MSQIGTPDLVFEPDNDTDDYTVVTAYIHEEFVWGRAEEKGRYNPQISMRDMARVTFGNK